MRKPLILLHTVFQSLTLLSRVYDTLYINNKNFVGGYMKNIYGYIRVSTKEQNTDRQHVALAEYEKENHIKFKTIFQDKASGKDFDRPQYQGLKNIIKSGDTVVIKELDRLGRNYDEIKIELSEFNSRRGLANISLNHTIRKYWRV